MSKIIRNKWGGFYPLTNVLFAQQLIAEQLHRWRYTFRDDGSSQAVWSEVESWRDRLMHYESLDLFVKDNFKTAVP
ncbi:hypothetical protein MTO96_047718 [Rhipicephalus appendiculatus]